MVVCVHNHQSCFPDSPFKTSSMQHPLPLQNRSPAVEEVLRPRGSSHTSLKYQRQNRLTIVFVEYSFFKSLLQFYYLKPLEASITY